MCDIGFVILQESKRGGISAPDFGYYLSRSARPFDGTDYTGTHSIQNHEKVKNYTDSIIQCGRNGIYPGAK